MEFIVGMILMGVAFVGLVSLGSSIFLDVKTRRDERDSHIGNW